MNPYIVRCFECLLLLRENRVRMPGQFEAELDAFISVMFSAGVIDFSQSCFLRVLLDSAFIYSGKPFPSIINAGPVIPLDVASERAKQSPKPVAVPVNESVQLQSVAASRKLHLLCMLVTARISKTEFYTYRFIPVNAVSRMPPYKGVSGRWNYAAYQWGLAAGIEHLSLGNGLYLR